MEDRLDIPANFYIPVLKNLEIKVSLTVRI